MSLVKLVLKVLSFGNCLKTKFSSQKRKPVFYFSGAATANYHEDRGLKQKKFLLLVL